MTQVEKEKIIKLFRYILALLEKKDINFKQSLQLFKEDLDKMEIK